MVMPNKAWKLFKLKLTAFFFFCMQGVRTLTSQAGATTNTPINLTKDDPHYSYMLNVVDPSKKGQYKVHHAP